MHVYLSWLHCSTRESQCLQHFNFVFLEIQNVPLRTVFANPVTYNYLVTVMALLASPHLVSVSHDYVCSYRPLTSLYDPTMANTVSLDHVISRVLFMCDWICKNRP